MRVPGLEPGSHRWQRYIVPLDQTRVSNSLSNYSTHEHISFTNTSVDFHSFEIINLKKPHES